MTSRSRAGKCTNWEAQTAMSAPDPSSQALASVEKYAAVGLVAVSWTPHANEATTQRPTTGTSRLRRNRSAFG